MQQSLTVKAHVEEAVRVLSSNVSALKPDSAEIEQRLSVFEAAISSQLEKLTVLSDQLTATATLVKDFGSPAHHSYDHSSVSRLQETDQLMLLCLALMKVQICLFDVSPL